jgi:hypothetical protein
MSNCPLGDDCDMTTAWMAGASDGAGMKSLLQIRSREHEAANSQNAAACGVSFRR